MSTMKQISNEILDIKGNIQTAIESKGQIVTDFASFPNAIMNISGGGSSFSEGDIKLFNSVEALNNDPDKNEGDLACVYTEGNLTNFYEYRTGLINEDIVAFHPNNGVTFGKDQYDNVTVTLDLETIPLLEVSKQSLINMTNKMIMDLGTIGNEEVLFFVDSNNILKAGILFDNNGTGIYNRSEYLRVYNYDVSGETAVFDKICSNFSNAPSRLTFITYNIDLDNMSFTEDETYNNWSKLYSDYYFLNNINILSYLICMRTDGTIKNIREFSSIFCYLIDNGSGTINFYYAYKNFDKKLVYNVYDAYVPISLSMTADEEYVLEDKFLGKNGVKTGILQNVTNLTRNQIQIKTNIWSEMSNLTLDSNVTDISELFKDRTDLVEIPNIDLTNITNMTNTFLNCSNLNDRAYATITNMLPVASQLSNQYISNMGLDINSFTYPEMVILNEKGYIDAVIP